MLIKYIVFAIMATILNILTQYLFLDFYQGAFKLYVAILAGTLTGLIFKYVLDKRFVFRQKISNELTEETKVFGLYSLMGVFTTFIFWGIEILFDYFLNYSWSKYMGAVIGLGIGYTIKFYLDKKFVFRNS